MNECATINITAMVMFWFVKICISLTNMLFGVLYSEVINTDDEEEGEMAPLLHTPAGKVPTLTQESILQK